MSDPPILLSGPDVDHTDRQALLRAFDDGWIAPVGPDLDAFEAELASYCEARAVVAVSSGTAALHLALVIAGVGPGDEVIVQSATFAASAFAVVHAGATPAFCDSEARTWCLDPDVLDEMLADRQRAGRLPKAVMPVDLYGSVADYQALGVVCAKYQVPIIRDAAEALGSIGETGPIGSFEGLAALSFNGNKIITTSSGGALVGDPASIERARFLATQAREPLLHYEHREIGFNYRLSNLLAALGRAQLDKLEAKIERRTTIANAYRDALPQFEWCPFGCTSRPNHWLTVALIPHGDPIEIAKRLHSVGVHARPAWNPMHRQPVFAGYEFAAGSGVADSVFRRGLCLPSGSAMTDGDVERVIGAISDLGLW